MWLTDLFPKNHYWALYQNPNNEELVAWKKKAKAVCFCFCWKEKPNCRFVLRKRGIFSLLTNLFLFHVFDRVVVVTFPCPSLCIREKRRIGGGWHWNGKPKTFAVGQKAIPREEIFSKNARRYLLQFRFLFFVRICDFSFCSKRLPKGKKHPLLFTFWFPLVQNHPYHHLNLASQGWGGKGKKRHGKRDERIVNLRMRIVLLSLRSGFVEVQAASPSSVCIRLVSFTVSLLRLAPNQNGCRENNRGA